MFWFHTLHGDMVNQPEALELEPYPDDLYQAVISALPGWITKQVAEIASLSINETSKEFTSALADVAEHTLRVVSQDLFVLLTTDVDAQQSNPLHVLRASTSQNCCCLPRTPRNTSIVYRIAKVSPRQWSDGKNVIWHRSNFIFIASSRFGTKRLQ